MATHKVVVIVTVDADTYDIACEQAAEFIDNAYNATNFEALGVLDANVELNFEEDNAGQRVLYLPGADGGGADEEDMDVDPDSVSLEDLAE